MKITGIIGYPLSHSVSPAMHNAAFRMKRIPAMYLPFEVNEFGFEAAVQGLRAMPLLGFNVTVPYKRAVLSHLNRITPESDAIGAVNTVVAQGKKWTGHNTDSEGFWRSLPPDWKKAVRNSSVLILGAGGAARAIAYALVHRGIRHLAIANRTPRKGAQLAKEVVRWNRSVLVESVPLNRASLTRAFREASWVINATSVGLGDAKGFPALPPWNGAAKPYVYDVQYHAVKSPLLRWAAQSRFKNVMDGRDMLLHQGALAWTLWTGRPAPLAAMRHTLGRTLALKRDR